MQENEGKIMSKSDGDHFVYISDQMKKEIKTVVEQIFEKIDTNKDGTLSLDEFKKGFVDHPDICGFFRQV
jgi:hypothetical protein